MNNVIDKILIMGFATFVFLSHLSMTSAFSGIHSVIRSSSYQPHLSKYTQQILIPRNNLQYRHVHRISCSMTLNEAEGKKKTRLVIDRAENPIKMKDKNGKQELNGAKICIRKEEQEGTDEVFDEEHHEKLITEKDEVVKEELEAAVKEVKDVFKEVTQSTGKLTGTIIEKGPGILTKTFRTLVSKKMR